MNGGISACVHLSVCFGIVRLFLKNANEQNISIIQ